MKKIFTLCVVLCLSYLSMGATNLKHEFRATWLTTAWGNDWPKTKVTNATTRKQQQDSLIAIFDRLQAGNMNAVCLQVRGRSDAFYQSSYEPWAAELAGARGTDPGYDPLAFAIEEAHKRGLELHAWVNPFRVTSAGTLASTDLVKKNAGQWIIQYNNGSFTGEIIDPGYPEAREYVLNVLMEIINNYDIDGIVMDDYFYPYGGTTTEDAASKALHKPANVVDVNKDGKTDDDWRRSNVDVFLEELYDRIQTKKPWVRFGMGTFGIWTTQSKVAQAYGISLPSGISGLDDYDEQACNPVEWVKNGYVDYINPQLYWPTTSTGQNYNKLCHWWAKDVCEHFSNQLTNGKKVHFFSSQSISSNSAVSEIQAEIDANRNNLSSGYTGSVFFDTDAYLTMDKDLMTSRFATNALTPPMDWKSNTALAAPTNLTVSGSTLTWQHATAERFTVYVYPKGTAWSTAKNDPAYLQGVIYGKSMDISGIDTNANDIAVCAYDRFGVEHTAAVYSNDSGAGTTPNPETIIWELNGGEVNTVTVEVPSLTTLEAQFKNDYNSYFGASVATTREITNFLYYGSKEEGGSNLVYNMMNDPASDWTWLRDYIISKSASNTTIQTALLAGTDAHWRYSIVAFLTASAGTNSTYTVDFSTAGQPSKWGTAYQIAHGAVLLPTYVTSAFTLPIPTHPEGHDFLGWYDNAEFIGSPLTIISADWTGSLYAKWQEDTPTIDPTWQITYTSIDGNKVTPYKTNVFGANIVSHTYENGVGTITFDGPVTSIGEEAFWYCESLTSITIPNSVMSIEYRALSHCTSLTSITIPNSVTSIGDYAFASCTSLTSITIPNSVTSIGRSAFIASKFLESIFVESGNTTYDSRENCNAIIETATNTLILGCQNTVIPNSVTSVGDYAFYKCSSMTSIEIPNSVTSIGEKAFSYCSSLASIIIPNSVESIGYSAFLYCSSLTSITLPNSVTSIGEEAFLLCESLTSITIPNSVTSIEERVFSFCKSIESIVVESGNTTYDSRNNCNAIIETATNTLISGCQNTIIPNSVTSIGNGAFEGCKFTSLTIPNSVTSIGNSAFLLCESLTSITIPNSITSIGYYAFRDCSSLDTIHLEATTPPALKDNTVFMNTPAPVCVIPCGTLAAYEASDWASEVSSFVEECPPASGTITYELNGGVQSEWETPQAMYNELNALWNTFSSTSKTWGDLSVLKADVAKGIPTLAYGMALDFIADENFKEKFEWLVTYMDAKCTEQGQTLPSSDASFLRYNLQAFFIDGMRTSWPISADYTICGVSTVEAYQPYWKSGFANPTNPTEEFVLNAPYKEGYTFAGWYTNADFSGEKVTTINAETTGTLYAKWINNDWIIYYTSTDGNKVTPYKTNVFGANIVSNTYENGVGTITFDGPVTSIGDYAFSGRSSLASITIPNSVTSIREGAFYRCADLTSITIPNSVTSIGRSAFYECLDLISITIPNSVTSIGDKAFGYCSSLTDIAIPNSVTSIEDNAFWYCSSLTDIAIPNSVTSIGEGAFYRCTDLTSITIPNSVTSIGDDAFYRCTDLTSITIPNSVTSIGDDAFFGCSSLTSLTIPSSVTSIGDDAFSFCGAITSMVVENGNTIYDSRENCNAIIETATNTLIAGCQNTIIPNSVTSIGNDAFYGCSSLTSLTIPNSVTSIGEMAFLYCSSLDTIHVEATTPPALEDSTVFMNTPAPVCVIPCGTLAAYEASDWASQVGSFMEDCVEGQQIYYTSTDGNIVTPYATDVFGANIVSNIYENGVGTITFDGPVTSIGIRAFINRSSLTSITIPNSITSIGTSAFYGCESLDSVNIPNSVNNLGWGAFRFCSSLKSIVIPNSVDSIGIYAFDGCTALSSIQVVADNPVFDSREDCNAIIETATNTLIVGCKNTIVPETVTTIGKYAFYRCTPLTSITIPNSVTYIDTCAFWSCSGLSSIKIPENVTTIEYAAFARCSNLNSITIPKRITNIGDEAFLYCTSLDTIYIEATTPPVLGYTVFEGTPAPVCVIPCGTLAAYEASDWASQVGSFGEDCVEGQQIFYTSTDGNIVTPYKTNVFGANIVSNTYENGVGTITFDGPVTSIGRHAFNDCSSLSSIVIPNTVENIGVCAFYGSSIISLDIPNSVTSLGDWAFADTPIESIAIPNSVTHIGVALLTACNSLTSIVVEEGNSNYDSRDNCNAIIEKSTNRLIATCPNTIIPNTVTTIATRAFQNSAITSIDIPNSVVRIEAYAFRWATQLNSITIPSSVGYIGDSVFYSCPLDTIRMEAMTPPTIGVNPLSSLPVCVVPCGSLAAYNTFVWASQVGSFVEDCVEGQQIYYTSTDGNIVTPTQADVFGANIVSNTYENGVGTITFDGPVTSIGENAFYGCSSLISITIPNSVTSIGSYAFYNCSFTSLTIPDGVMSIGPSAFLDCYRLTSIIIPNSVTSIRYAAFGGCSRLTSMVVESGNTIYDSREDCNAIIETATNTLISGCQNTIIPNSVTTIYAGAFYRCRVTLKSITIPNSVRTIGDYAFGWCSSLTSVTLSSSVTSIGDRAFYSCSSLNSINIPNNVASIGEYAFYGCSSLYTIRVEAITPPTLGVDAFTSSPLCNIPCGTLAAYEASDWASQVGEFIEEGCPTVQMCGDNLYWEYADGVLTITGTGNMYDYAADADVPWYDVRGDIKTVSLPDAMTKIGQNAFYKCTAMTSINMPTSLTAIGEKAFAQDTKLACEIILPASMTTIASRAFFNCQAVTAFHIETTTPPTIPNDAFERTTAPIHVPCGYGHIYGKHTQWGMLNLEMCELLQDNVYYYPIDGHTARAVTYHSDPTDTIVIPSAVVIDGMPRTVTEVADFAFTDCKDIPAIIFNEGLEYIGERAFVRCYGLHGTIVLPATLETIGERAFSYCDNVEKYLIQAMTPPALGDGAFTCANHDALFYVSCEVMDDYKVATNWSSLKSRLRDACLNIYHYNTALGTNGVYTTEDTLVASIYYRRHFTPNRWETLYLPFEVDRVTVLEEGFEYELTAWSIFSGGHYFLAKPYGIENKEVVFGFTQVVDAHTPYIIQFKDEYYRDKIITFYSEESWNKLSTSFEMLSSSYEMQMAGNTTMQDQILEEPVYMLRGTSNFILQNTTTVLHPFECYVMPSATSSGTPARMNVRFRGDVPTAVESVKGNESHLTYTVDGYTLTVYPQGQAFSIYSLNGALIYSCEAGKEAVDCELNSGCYLLHAGTEAHKIML